MSEQKVYVMIGLPGAGKDTWIKNNLPNCKNIICRDDIRAELGFCKPGEKIVGTNEQENKVNFVYKKRLVDWVAAGEDVVINNTNLKRKYRNEYHKLLSNFPVKWIYVIVTAPSIEENILRRKDDIPGDIIRRMAENTQPPEPEEYDELINYQNI